MKPTLLLVALSCVALCCHAQQRAFPHAELRAQSTAEGTTVLLGDIAELSGAPADELALLARTPLAVSPQPGAVLHLSQHEIAHLLTEAGVRDLALDGAEATTVTIAAALFDPERLVATAKEALASKLAREGRTLELAADGLPSIRLPHGEVSLNARDVAAQQPRSRMTVWVDILVDGAFYRAQPVTFRVTAREGVLVARNDLSKGMVPGCANLEMQQRDVATLPGQAQGGSCAELTRRLRRNLAAGDVLLSGELEAVPIVSEGEYVTLEVREGAVMLESRALAVTDGQIGQRIPVRPTTSEETVLATVIGPGLVNFSGR